MRLFTIPFLLVTSCAAAVADDFSTQLMLCTGKLSDSEWAATAFILSRPSPADAKQSEWLLITAGHALAGSKSEEATLLLHQKQPDGTYKNLPVQVKVRKDRNPLWTKHPTADVAVMRVALPPTVDVPRLPVGLLATDEMMIRYEIHPGDAVLCLGYPHRFEQNHGSFAVLRSGMISSYPLVPAKAVQAFHVSFNTFEGDSGGPIYVSQPNRVLESGKVEPVRLILGLVHGQHFIDEDVKTAYETRKMRTRLGLSIVVPAAMIRETIERLPRPPGPPAR